VQSNACWAPMEVVSGGWWVRLSQRVTLTTWLQSFVNEAECQRLLVASFTDSLKQILKPCCVVTVTVACQAGEFFV
jgi:hypothetical protein